MVDRWIVSEESKELGILGYVRTLTRSARRVYSRNMLICVLMGKLSCEYESRNYDMNKGDLIFISEGSSFSYAPENCTVLYFSIPTACFPELSGKISLASAGSASDLPYRPIHRLLGEILHAQYEGGTHYSLKLQSVWKEMIYLLLTGFLTSSGSMTGFQKETASRTRHDHDFAEILSILGRSYMEPLQLNELAEMFYYTPSHLSRLFQKYTGMHFMKYLTELRLQVAMPLLLQTAQEIQFIAQKTGFPNARAFSLAFQEKYGMKPSDYRRQLFQEIAEDKGESIRNNIRFLYQQHYFDVLQEKSCVKEVSAEAESLEFNNKSVFSQKEIPSVSFSQEGSKTVLPDQQCILNIPRLKDLLLDEVQAQLNLMQEELHFTYLNCHGFLSDDMQIYTPDTAVYGNEHGLEYSFMLYEKVFRFLRSNHLKIIIQLGYTPSFLSSKGSGNNMFDDSNLLLPDSFDEWADYLTQLFTYLYKKFGNWLLSCPVILCPIMEYAIVRHGKEEDTYFSFYLRTFHVLRTLLPEIKIVSPPLTCTKEGLLFAKRYLRFCQEQNCIPEEINLCFVESAQTKRLYHIQPYELQAMQGELLHQLKLLKYPKEIPVHLMEYYYSLKYHPICESCVGAMFPLKTVLAHHMDFQRFGYWYATDCTTEAALGGTEFSGGHGLLTQSGSRKASYFALLFLSHLGHTHLVSGDGYVITREGTELRMLFFYDIPPSEWVEPFDPEHIDLFYSAYPDRIIRLPLSDLPNESILIMEEVVNYASGSAYEKWLSCGGKLLNQYMDSHAVFNTNPEIYLKTCRCENGNYVYEAQLKPFEMRFVTIKDNSFTI